MRESEQGQRSELLEEFVAEATEHLDLAESLMVAAEGGNLETNARAELFRAMHSIKGAAGYLGLNGIQQLAHAMETAVQRLGLGYGQDGGRWESLLEGITELRRLVSVAGEPATAPDSLLMALECADESTRPAAPTRTTPRHSLENIFLDVADQQCQAMRVACQELAVNPDGAAGQKMLRRAMASLRSAAEYAGREEVIGLLDRALPAGDGEIEPGAVERLLASLEERLHPDGRREPENAEAASGSKSSPTNNGSSPTRMQPAIELGRTLRVAQSRVDLLIEQAGELVTVRNQIDHFISSLETEDRGASLYRRGKAIAFTLGRIVEEIHRLSVELRLVRLEALFRRLPRVARDAASHLGKRVNLEITGGEVELDKGIAEAIADPLVHMVRNSVDHGIEPPEIRAGLGKAREGLVRVSARREAGHVVIAVEDDGRGVDVEAVRQAAVDKGLLDPRTAAALSEEGVHELLFHPGFSTAATVTEISGRGVGLDVVRANVARQDGTVTLTSRRNAGTRVEIRLPVRMAAREVVLARVQSESVAIPLDGVLETLSVRRTQLRAMGGLPATVRDGRVMPIVSLAEALGLAGTPARPDTLELLVVSLAGQPVAFAVDEIGQHCQVVVKPLDGCLASGGIEGAAVLADGRVVLVVDPSGLLATHAGVSAASPSRPGGDAQGGDHDPPPPTPSKTVGLRMHHKSWRAG